MAILNLQSIEELIVFKRRAYLVSFVTVLLLSLQGCAGTSTLYSNTFVKPATQITKLNVLYIESNLVSKSSKTGMQFYDIGYTDLPELLRERVPIVFAVNNIGSEYATFKSQGFGQKEAMESIKWASGTPDAMLLTLQVLDGNVVSGSHTPRTTTLNMQANLIDPKTTLRQWTGQFRNTFVAPPVGKNGFDNGFVDNLLKTVLEQMSRDGIIALVEHKAVLPLAKPAAAAN